MPIRKILLFPVRVARRLIIDLFHNLGFFNIYRSTIYGPRDRVHLGKNVGHGNNVFYNTRSGHIYVGDDTILSFHCMFLTGIHLFENGRLKQPRSSQVPTEGYDIKVGSQCWVASGAIVIGGVTIGDNSIVTAGAVVTKSFPPGSILGGVPARIIGRVEDLGKKGARKGISS
jgi:acetyltransferase-like isoleucine patch superfamily enzyme